MNNEYQINILETDPVYSVNVEFFGDGFSLDWEITDSGHFTADFKEDRVLVGAMSSEEIENKILNIDCGFF